MPPGLRLSAGMLSTILPGDQCVRKADCEVAHARAAAFDMQASHQRHERVEEQPEQQGPSCMLCTALMHEAWRTC